METFQIGEKIGDYTINSFIKKGAIAESYVVSAPDNKTYFLKLFDMEAIPSTMLFDGKEVYEIQLCQELKHDNVISYVTKGEIRKSAKLYHYLVTEYYKGQLLSDSIQNEGVIDPESAANITLCVLSGLEYIHSRALIHNDIVPSNIMLQDMEGGAVLPIIIDLGHISYMVMGRPTFYVEDLMPFFRAPETFKGIYTPKSDLFSAGALFYYMMFGHAPWEADISECHGDKAMVKEAVKNARREDLVLETADVKLSDIYKQILTKALAKNADDRFASATEFSKALIDKQMSHIDDGPAEGQPAAPTQPNQVSGENNNAPLKEITFKKGSGNGFDNVAGRDELKEQLRKEVLFVLQNPEKAKKYKLTPLNGILLYGPPGCGKTLVMKNIAEESGFNYAIINAQEFGNVYQEGVVENLQRAFEAAASNAPSLLCIDELEFLVPNISQLSDDGPAMTQGLQVSALMTGCSEKGILVVGTSNRPDLVDPSILHIGCIDRVYLLTAPDLEARKDIFRNHLKDRPCEELNYDELGKLSDGFVAGDITEAINEAAMTAAYNDVPISQKILVDVIKFKNPSYSMHTKIGFNK